MALPHRSRGHPIKSKLSILQSLVYSPVASHIYKGKFIKINVNSTCVNTCAILPEASLKHPAWCRYGKLESFTPQYLNSDEVWKKGVTGHLAFCSSSVCISADNRFEVTALNHWSLTKWAQCFPGKPAAGGGFSPRVPRCQELLPTVAWVRLGWVYRPDLVAMDTMVMSALWCKRGWKGDKWTQINICTWVVSN